MAVSAQMRVYVWGVASERDGSRNDSAGVFRPFREIQKAIQFSLPGLISNVKGDERNVLLTLSRMWFTLETEDVTTKDVAAEWVIPQLPETFSSLLKTAKEAYLGNLSDEWETMENETLALTGFMKGRIEELLKAKG